MPLKILIIAPNWLGDTLFTTPAIKAIRRQCKDAYIAVLSHSRCAPILEDNPYINEVIILEKIRGLSGFFVKLKFIPNLKIKNFNTVFLFSRSMSYALMCVLAGIKQRIGYGRLKSFILLTHKAPPLPVNAHRVEYYLGIIKALDITADNKDYDFFIKPQYQKQAKAILAAAGVSENQAYFVINPGGNWLPKRWPKEKFSGLADALSDKYKIKVIITGASKDIALAQDIIKLSNIKPVNLCGMTSLKELAGLLKGAKALISNDSGPMHIGISQRTPTVALFGPTEPSITGPYGSSKYVVVRKKIDCSVPCYSKTCSDYRCMKAITVADVMEAVASVIASEVPEGYEAKQSPKA